MFKTLSRTIVITMLLVSTFALSMSSAMAKPADQTSARAVQCTGSGCNGKDPVAMGCNADARTTWFGYAYEGSRRTAQMELRWSPTCKTHWARVYNFTYNQYPVYSYTYGWVESRKNDDTIKYYFYPQKDFTYTKRNQREIYTNMFYAPSIPTRVCGGATSISIARQGDTPVCSEYR